MWFRILAPGVSLTLLITTHFINSDNRDDHQPRTCILAFLSHLDSSNDLHQRLMEKLVSDLLEKVYSTEWKKLVLLSDILPSCLWKGRELIITYSPMTLNSFIISLYLSSVSLQENYISQSKVRYYSNSLQHRVKNRVWQTLLLLLPKLREVRWKSHTEHSASACACMCVCTRVQEFVDPVMNRMCMCAGVCWHCSGPCVWS